MKIDTFTRGEKLDWDLSLSFLSFLAISCSYLTRPTSSSAFEMIISVALSFFLTLHHRAKIQIENKKGHTALDIAKAYADPRVVAIVQKRWDEIPPPVDKKKRE